MSMERQYRIVLAAVRGLPLVEMIAGPSYPWLNWRCAMLAARLTEGL